MNTQDFKETNPQGQGEAVDINTDENIGAQNLHEPIADEGELEKLKAQVEELNDRYLRQVAEFENFKRRTAKERMELIQTAGKDVITDLLDVLDDSERAERSMEEADELSKIKEGIQLVFAKLRNNLAAKGLKPMDAKGKPFDADLHEAVTEIDAGPDMKGKVVDEIHKGYYLNDKIIRYAKVVVGR